MKTKMHWIPAFAMACLLTAGLSAVRAVEESGTGVSDEDLVLARNPIIIKSRVRLASEFTDAGGGDYRDKWILGAAYGFGFNGHDRNFGIGFELPFLRNHPKGGASDSGIGDLKLRFGQIFIDDPNGWRAGWFFETEFDTAVNAVQAIANQRTQMALGGGASYPIWRNFVLSSTLQYGWSLDEGATTGEKSEWEAHLTASAKLTPCMSLNLDYKPVIKTEHGSELFNTLEPSVGWTLGANKNLGLIASCELPLDHSSTDWIAKVGTIWFF
jgi:hypothetical protein